MSPYDLTTLAALKAWLGLPAGPGPSDATLAALATAASRTIYALLSRPGLLPQAYTETLDLETPARHPQAMAGAAGQFGAVARHRRSARPRRRPRRARSATPFSRATPRRREGRRRSICSATAIGPAGRASSSPIAQATRCRERRRRFPPSAPFQLSAFAPYGPWGSDLGVVYSSTGAALAPVAAAPGAGQYAVSAGVYTFSAADAGQAVALSYGYVPQDVAQAALELAAERFRAAEHIGLRSKSVGGQETIAYDASAIPAAVLAMLQPYKRVAF